MKLDRFKLLADENIHRDVVRFLRDRGFDVLDVAEEGMLGTTDVDLLRRAVSEDRVVMTHDRDFGTLAILTGGRSWELSICDRDISPLDSPSKRSKPR